MTTQDATTIVVEGMTPSELDAEVQRLLWDHRHCTAAQIIAEWIEWDQVGRWAVEELPVVRVERKRPKSATSIAGRISGEFGTLGAADDEASA